VRFSVCFSNFRVQQDQTVRVAYLV